MMNLQLNTQLITNAIAPAFQYAVPYIMTGSRQFQYFFGSQNTYQRGDTISLRQRYQAGDVQQISNGGPPTANIVGLQDAVDTLTIDQQFIYSFNMNSRETTLKLDDLDNRYYQPIVYAFANKVERWIAQKIAMTANYYVGTPGVALSSYDSTALISQRMNSLGMPNQEGRNLVISLQDGRTLRGNSNLQNNFYSPLPEGINMRGALGHLDVFDIYDSQNTWYQVAGPFTPAAPGGNITLNGLHASGVSALTLEGFAPSTLVSNPGDVITLQGITMLNTNGNILTPGNYPNNDMSVVVQGEVPIFSDAGGNAIIPISPTLIYDSANNYKNIAVPLASGTIVTQLPSHSVGLAYSAEAIELAFPPMTEAATPYSYQNIDQETGLSMRSTATYDGINDLNLFRMDLLAGMLLRNKYAVRVVS